MICCRLLGTLILGGSRIFTIHFPFIPSVYRLYLVVFRGERAVAHHDAVQAKSLEVGLVAEVAAVKYAVATHDALVYPVPDEAAKHAWMTVDFVPILLEVAEGVAHRMSVLTGEHGARTTVGTNPCATVAVTLGNLQEPFPTGILSPLLVAAFGDAGIEILLHHSGIEARDDIDSRGVWIALGTLIVNGACGVELVEPSRHRSMVGTVATLVAKTPEDDAGVVLVTLSHADASVHKGVGPVGRRGEGTAQTVSLAVGLIHDVHAHRVTELVPAGTIGIVGQSHGVDVGLLHQSQVLKHTLLSHYAGRIGVVLMAVDATYLDGFAVDEQLTAPDSY